MERRPQLALHGRAKELADEMGLTDWDISLSHSDTLAIAIAVAKAAG